MITELILLASTAALPALPRIDPLTPQPSVKTMEATKMEGHVDGDTLCTADSDWCFALSRQEETDSLQLTLFNGRDSGTRDARRAAETWIFDTGVVVDDGEEFHRKLWPYAIRQMMVGGDGAEPSETLSIGIISSISTMYSGGGGQAEVVAIYRVPIRTEGTPPLVELLSLPLNTSLLIRACFSDKDYENRRGACHDQYDYNATITLSPKQDRLGLARLVYRAKTVTVPGSSRRLTDNSRNRKLSAADILPRTNAKCTYQRIVAFNPTTKQYEFDRPGPDCSEYTVP